MAQAMNDDGLDVPAFLILSAAQRREGWERNPPKPMPMFGRVLTETERQYRASKDRDEAFRKSTTAYVERKRAFLESKESEREAEKAVKEAAAKAARENRRAFRKRKR